MGLRTVGVKLVADVSNYTSNMHKATQSTKSFSEGLGDKAAKGKLDAIADRAGVVGLAVGAGFALAVKSAAEFDKQMSSGQGGHARLRGRDGKAARRRDQGGR
jgi:hypothetical protein